MTASISFTTAYVLDAEYWYAAAAGDDFEAFDRHTRLVQFNGVEQPHWSKHDVEWLTRSVTALLPADENAPWFLCALSDEGEVEFIGQEVPFIEKIAGAGVFSEGAENWGYLADLQQIGGRLYACGYCGQVYQRRSREDWVHLDSGILQSPDTARNESIALSVVNGPHENAIYTAGYQHSDGLPPKAFFWNGELWRELELPPVAERITNLYIENEQRIWMCGSNGTLLLGNATDGFTSLSTVNDNQLFLSLCKFQEKIYLGSNLGLFVYDPNDHEKGIIKVVTGMTPELQDANIVDCAGDILWSIGPKDIARFDGTAWSRIHHPDNERIGE